MERVQNCKTEEETAALGARLAKRLTTPAFVALHGDLGAGKTAFVRGMGSYLGTDDVHSPTFTIVREHDTSPRLLHFDAYRLSNADELYAIGFDEYLSENAVLVMEWAELVEEALPDERLDVYIEGSGDEVRRLRFCPQGAAYEQAVADL